VYISSLFYIITLFDYSPNPQMKFVVIYLKEDYIKVLLFF
jgi:hypothetical protein